MPNLYTGTTTIKGNVERFRKWYIETLQNNSPLNVFAQTFAPLSSGEYSFSNSCEEWGVKWDFEINIISGLDEEDEEFIFTFDSAWNSPYYLWKQLETKYDVIVEEHGYEEGNRFFYKYYNGKHIVKEIDLYDEWFLEKLNFIPSEEALKNEEIYDEELMEYSYENMNNVFENWHINVSENEKEWEDVILPNIN
tara:strand:+ start:241 stop:822 length:582 start_codon:yes stop_codon:yes gene_type:complete